MPKVWFLFNRKDSLPGKQGSFGAVPGENNNSEVQGKGNPPGPASAHTCPKDLPEGIITDPPPTPFACHQNRKDRKG